MDTEREHLHTLLLIGAYDAASLRTLMLLLAMITGIIMCFFSLVQLAFRVCKSPHTRPLTFPRMQLAVVRNLSGRTERVVQR